MSEKFGATLKKPYVYWSVILFSMLARYLYYGFRYFPVVDDNIMYGSYSLTSPLNALLSYKAYAARPFAVLLDTYVISRLWGNLAIILILMIILHFLAALLLYKVFEKNGARVGILLVLYFTLNPLGTDAAYWIAASSRLVAGLFFASLSFYLIMLLDGSRQCSRPVTALLFAGYFLSSLLSCGFYEQVTAFSIVFSLLLIAVRLKKSRRLAMLGITLANLALTAFYYYYFRSVGTVGERGQLIQENVWKHMDSVTDRFTYLLYNDFLSMVKHGIINGWNIIAQDKNWLYLLAVLLVSAAAAVIYGMEEMRDSRKTIVIKLLTGLSVALVSYTPFYILNYTWISNRNTFISFIGVGLMLETLIYLAFRWIKGTWARYLKGLLFGAVIFAFMLTNAAEVHNYKQVSEIDAKIFNSLIGQYQGMENGSKTIFVFNTKSLYVDTTGRHLSNCTGVEWAFSPAFYSFSRARFGYLTVMPLKNGVSTEVDLEKLESSPLFGVFEDFRACRLNIKEETPDRLSLVQENGESFGEIEIGADGAVIFKRAVSG